MLKNENFPCFVLTCSPKRVVCGPAGGEHGGKHGGVSVPDDGAAGLATTARPLTLVIPYVLHPSHALS